MITALDLKKLKASRVETFQDLRGGRMVWFFRLDGAPAPICNTSALSYATEAEALESGQRTKAYLVRNLEATRGRQAVNLQVGKWYETRNGAITQITYQDANRYYAFRDASGGWFDAGGTSADSANLDLIRELPGSPGEMADRIVEMEEAFRLLKSVAGLSLVRDDAERAVGWTVEECTERGPHDAVMLTLERLEGAK